MHAAVLRYFEAVAEEGSIRRASERLHISPSAVDRQILKLEGYFGTPLFERRPNGMRLTDAGRLVLRHSRDTLHDFARLRGDIDNLRGVVSGQVTITTLDSLTVHFLPEAMARFVAAHPAVQIRVVALDPVETMHSVAQGHADLGLTFSPARRRGVSLLADVPSPMCAIMAPDHELAARSSLTLDECGAFRLLYQDHSGSMQPFFGTEMDAFKSAHQPLVVSNTLAVLKRLLLAGRRHRVLHPPGIHRGAGRRAAGRRSARRRAAVDPATVPDRPLRPPADGGRRRHGGASAASADAVRQQRRAWRRRMTRTLEGDRLQGAPPPPVVGERGGARGPHSRRRPSAGGAGTPAPPRATLA